MPRRTTITRGATKPRHPVPPVPQPPPVPPVPPVPQVPPPTPVEKRYSMTELAALCGVTEQTIRRWWLRNLIAPPNRQGRTLYWPCEAGNKIVETYNLTGRPSVLPKECGT